MITLSSPAEAGFAKAGHRDLQAWLHVQDPTVELDQDRHIMTPLMTARHPIADYGDTPLN
jgi:hypothetical protein